VEVALFYGAFFTAQVALLGIALPLTLTLLFTSAERFSPRIVQEVLLDVPLLALLLAMVALSLPSAIGVSTAVAQTVDPKSQQLTGLTVAAFPMALIAFALLVVRAQVLL
jgi:uncharacterized membrane protein